MFFFEGLQEVWTVCRILKRNVTYRKYTPDWGELSAKGNSMNARAKACNLEAGNKEVYNISFGASAAAVEDEKKKKPVILSEEAREFFTNGNWDEIASVMDFSFDPYHHL